jgi:CRP-like cAMP-binding protein
MAFVEACYTNGLLAALPGTAFHRISPHLQEVELELGQVLGSDDRPVSYVYFPITALVSVLCHTRTGATVEVALIGSDGVVGMSFADAYAWTPGLAVVQHPGQALRVPMRVMREEFARGGPLQLLTLRYARLLTAQIAQTALCNRLHHLDEQLCRWILVHMDRYGSHRIEATQQQVAAMLGVRREGVSAAARKLQEAGVLHWGRGRLRVTDRVALESHCCECYDVVRDMARRVFALTPPSE